jgi:hypothetical protein
MFIFQNQIILFIFTVTLMISLVYNFASIVSIDNFGFAHGSDASRADAGRVFSVIQLLGFAVNMAKTVIEPSTRSLRCLACLKAACAS